jgi:hypothetical protein
LKTLGTDKAKLAGERDLQSLRLIFKCHFAIQSLPLAAVSTPNAQSGMRLDYSQLPARREFQLFIPQLHGQLMQSLLAGKCQR